MWSRSEQTALRTILSRSKQPHDGIHGTHVSLTSARSRGDVDSTCTRRATLSPFADVPPLWLWPVFSVAFRCGRSIAIARARKPRDGFGQNEFAFALPIDGTGMYAKNWLERRCLRDMLRRASIAHRRFSVAGFSGHSHRGGTLICKRW